MAAPGATVEAQVLDVQALIRRPLAGLSDEELAVVKVAVNRDLRESAATTAGSPQQALLVQNMADIEPLPLRWLWPGVIPLGKLTMLVGDPGLGKSLITLDIAARVSRGAPWTDSTQRNQVARVILLSAEDDPSDTIRPRLDAADALPGMVSYIQAVRKGKGRRAFNLEADIGKLEEVITERTRLIIIDPITAYMGETDSHVNASVRSLLAPLADLAARRRVAIVAVSHLNKSGGPAMYRTTGSLAFVAAARAVWAVGRDPEDETRVLMLPVKQNLARNEGGFAYRIELTETTSGITAPRVAWEPGRVRGDVNDLLQAGRDGEDRSEQTDAVAWLRQELAGGEVPAREIFTDGRNAGFTEITLKRAKKSIGVASERKGFGKGSVVSWRLPGPIEDHQTPIGDHTGSPSGVIPYDPVWGNDPVCGVPQGDSAGVPV